jgi:hypothetical protein
MKGNSEFVVIPLVSAQAGGKTGGPGVLTELEAKRESAARKRKRWH